jgi:hypothetical protein
MSINMRCDVPVILLIATNEYAGNFEREMCGYVTGTHDGTHGHIESAVFDKEVGAQVIDPEYSPEGIASFIAFVPDKHAYPRCAYIWNEGPDGNSFQSVAIFFEEWPERFQVLMLERIKEFPTYMATQPWKSNRNLQILGVKLLRRTVTITDQVTVLDEGKP